MAISGVGQNYYQNNVAIMKGTQNVNNTEKFALEKASGTQELSEAAFKAMKDDPQYKEKDLLEEYLEKRLQTKKQQQEMLNAKASNAYDANVSDEKEMGNKTDIIVKPDGSRVLVVTMSVGGMETTMSIEISKSTNMQNDNLKHDNDNGGTPVSESETISNDISDSVGET